MKKVFLLCAMAASTMLANAVDTSTDYIAKWGNLTVKGRQLTSSKTGEAVQLKGWSSFGNYDENCVKPNSDAIPRMKGMGANCVRLAKYFETGYGEYTVDQIKGLMAQAASNGMYCIVDWHILEAAGNNGNPNNYTSKAQDFFKQIAQEVVNKNYKHVIYELCNEPSGCSAAQIKTYAESVISTITGVDKSNPIIIVGTPNWDQYINSQTIGQGQTVSYANAMYAFHFYANEDAHKALLNQEFVPATQKVPVFVSEWGMSHAMPEKYNGDKWNDVNETVANDFIGYCNGQNGAGQIVSWMNWSYGNKMEGSSTFKSGCAPGDGGSNLSRSGKWIVGVLGGEINPEIVRGAAYGGTPYTLSKTSDKEQLNLDAYDQNPKAAEEEPGGSMDVTYYDANNTPDENYVEGEEYDPLKLVDALDHDPAGNKEGKVIQCYAGRAWCNTRAYECVDLTGARVEGSWGAATGLSWVSSGEWLNYTFKVEDAGYYSLEYCIGAGNVGYGTSSLNAETGEITRTAAASFSMSLTDHASQVFMVDIDASTETKETAIEKDEFVPFAVKEDQVVEVSSDRVWTPCSSNKTGTKKANHGILFKEPGEYIVKLMFANGFNDQLASLRFSYAKAWSGEGWPEEVVVVDPDSDGTGVENAAAEGIKVYPSVVENGEFTVAVEGAAQVVVSNMAGAAVYTANVEGTTTINANLAAGVYNVQVVSADAAANTRIIVK